MDSIYELVSVWCENNYEFVRGLKKKLLHVVFGSMNLGHLYWVDMVFVRLNPKHTFEGKRIHLGVNRKLWQLMDLRFLFTCG